MDPGSPSSARHAGSSPAPHPGWGPPGVPPEVPRPPSPPATRLASCSKNAHESVTHGDGSVAKRDDSGFGHAPQLLERLPGRDLLRRLLRRARADAELLTAHLSRTREAAVVRRALDLEDDIHDLAAPASHRFLQLGLVVHVLRERVLDLVGECRQDRLANRLEAVL